MTSVDQAGRTHDDYIKAALHEARTDVLAYGDIVSWGKRRFKLEGDELGGFVDSIVRALLSAGAVIVRPKEVADGHEWHIPDEYNVPDVEARIEALAWDARRLNDEQGFFAWFSFAVPKLSPRVDLSRWGN